MEKLLRRTLLWYIVTYMLIFVLTLLLLVPIYRMAYTSARNVMERSLTSVLSAGVDRLANELLTLDRYANSIMDKSETVDMAYRPDVNNSHLIKAIKLREQLCDTYTSGLLLVDDMIMLFEDSDYVVSKGIVQRRDRYWENMLEIEGMTQEKFEQELLDKRMVFFPKARVYTKYMMQGEDAVCMNYFSQTRAHTYYAICAVITTRAIHDIVREDTVDSHGWMRITDAYGNVLYSSRAPDVGECSEWSFTSEILPITLEAGVDNSVFA